MAYRIFRRLAAALSLLAGLGLAEIELRNGQPEAAKPWLDAITPDDDVDRLEHALLLEIFTREGVGTQVVSTDRSDKP